MYKYKRLASRAPQCFLIKITASRLSRQNDMLIKIFILFRGLKFLHFLSCNVSHCVAQSLKYQRIKLVKSLFFVNFVYGNQAFPYTKV